MTPRNYSQLVKTLGISQRAIAKEASCTQNTVWKILRDKGEKFYSEATKQKVLSVIDRMVDEKQAELKSALGNPNA